MRRGAVGGGRSLVGVGSCDPVHATADVSSATLELEPARPWSAKSKAPFACIGHKAALLCSAGARTAAEFPSATRRCRWQTLIGSVLVRAKPSTRDGRHEQADFSSATLNVEPKRPRRAKPNAPFAWVGHKVSLPCSAGPRTAARFPIETWRFRRWALVGWYWFVRNLVHATAPQRVDTTTTIMRRSVATAQTGSDSARRFYTSLLKHATLSQDGRCRMPGCTRTPRFLSFTQSGDAYCCDTCVVSGGRTHNPVTCDPLEPSATPSSRSPTKAPPQRPASRGRLPPAAALVPPPIYPGRKPTEPSSLSFSRHSRSLVGFPIITTTTRPLGRIAPHPLGAF